MFNLEETANKSLRCVVRSFICDALHIKSDVAIKSVKRMGQPRRDGKPLNIIADLCNGSDVDLLFRNVKHLKGTKMSLGRQYPEEIEKARERLKPERRQAMKDKKRAVIDYPAKLVIDGVIVKDEFPDWFSSE